MVGARFATPIQTGSGAYLALGVKWQGHDMKYPLPFIVEVRERVELFLFSASAFRAGYRVNFTFTFIDVVLLLDSKVVTTLAMCKMLNSYIPDALISHTECLND
jgi:hypothetical protein